MEYFFALAGLAWVFCGALILGLSFGGTHEIVACLAISFGVLFLGLAVLLRQLITLNASSRSPRFASFPPPIPEQYVVSIEEVIDGVRTAVRLAERHAWIEAIEHSIAYPSPVHYFEGTSPHSLPPSEEYLEGEYYVEQPWPNRQIPN